jgi:phosphate:Na+ symporter
MQQFWEFLAGLGLFLFALHLMETSLKDLAGRTFKLFLKKYTSNTLGAVTSSAITTGILQSSSVVIMTILTFVGAGIVSMRNALAVTIGSNFGTTIDSWLVATVGFKVEIDLIAFPLVGIAAITLAFVADKSKAFYWFRFLLGFGFLFMGLSLMKDGMGELLKDFDLTRFENYPRIVFVGIGFVMTALIQSSSAAMAIFLSALNTGSIPFEATVAAVIGSELATTLKVILGSIGGIAAKWQLAIGNFLFNSLICTLAFIFMDGYMWLAEKIVGSDPLLQLVAFQSSINLVGVIFIAPFLNPFSRLLEKYVKGREEPSSFVVHKKLLNSGSIAMDALEEDVNLLLQRILHLNLEAFGSVKKNLRSDKALRLTLQERNKKLKTFGQRYEDLKKAEGEILAFALGLTEKQPEHSPRISTLINVVRHAMHSAKAMKDVQHNRIEFHESADDTKFKQYIDFRRQLEAFYTSIDDEIADQKHPALAGLINRALVDYNERQDKIYEASLQYKLSAEDVSSLLNVNRELYTSCKTIVQALQLYHRSEEGKAIGKIP